MRVYDSPIDRGFKRCIVIETIGLKARNSQHSSILNEIFHGLCGDTSLCIAVLSFTMYRLYNISINHFNK